MKKNARKAAPHSKSRPARAEQGGMNLQRSIELAVELSAASLLILRAVSRRFAEEAK